ncbi:MAG: DUF2207 domain-containing protein [Desulfotomaculaceae bacterium]|nr:DUF2207 domain-containing protein [Desulfotomaculaceae bacterium]
MKRNDRRWLKLKSGLFMILLGLLLPLVFAEPARADRSFTMQQVVVEAEVLSDCSMQVTERLTVDFSGQWNGFFITIPRSDSPVQNVTVSENGRPYTFNPETKYGPPGTYLIKNESNKTTIDWSINAKDEQRVFDISYRVVNAVKVHSDVAELYRKFIGSDNAQRIREVLVNLKLPTGAANYEQGKDILIWGHGPLNGEVNFTAPDAVAWQVKNLGPYTFVEGRVVMPAALFSGAPAEAYTGKTALAGILSEESDWAKDANRQRWQARAEIGGAAAIVLLALGIAFLLWRRYGKAYSTQFDGPYYRELPGQYSPAELSVLWNYKKIKAQDLTATIMDLARRRFLSIEEERQEVRKMLGTREVKTYRLTFLPAPEPASLRKPEEAVLRPHERDLLDYLEKTIAGGRGFVYLSDIEQYAKKNGRAFYDFWRQWTAGLNKQGEDMDFFAHSDNIPLITLLAGLLLFILGTMAVANTEMSILGAALIFAGVVVGLVPRSFKKRSAAGQEDFTRWQAFRRFLQHFSQMERYEIPSLIVWEHYLVYAVTLGVAREVIKQLEIVFPNMQDGDYHFGYGWLNYGSLNSFQGLHDSFNDIGNVVERSVKSAQAAVSKSSSGSGGGGGFSSGGGGGGGGSSYGGR